MRKAPRLDLLGYRAGQLGGVLMMLGGLFDLTFRSLPDSHVMMLGVTPDAVPAATEGLVLALLHALGASLVGAGLAVLALLREARRSGDRVPLLVAAAVAVLAEGLNAVGIRSTGSLLYLAPLSFLLLVVGGVALMLVGRGVGSSAPHSTEAQMRS